MERLENMLRKLMGVEYSIDSLCVILKALEAHYEEAGIEEVNAIICIVKEHIEMSGQQLADSITELDKYLLSQK